VFSVFAPGPKQSVVIDLHHVESSLLTDLFGQLIELLNQEDPAGRRDQNGPTSDDPLATELGLTGLGLGELGDQPPSEPPADAALARLLPDAYADDKEAAADFRRYTEADLRSGKRGRARTAIESLRRVADGGRLTLDHAEALAWLGALNDLRLVLGVRLDITDEEEQPGAGLDEEDPLALLVPVYTHLGYLQESLVDAIAP
jgi:hypothetical protein